MKSLTKIVFLFAVVIAPVLFVPIPASAGLVPCGTAEHPEACTLCHILVGGQGIITWGMGIMVIVGLALIMIAGVVYIISVGDNGRMTTAKGIIEKAIGGLALILCGWLIVNTIIGLLARDNMGIGVQKTNWYTFTCDSSSSANTEGSSGTGIRNTPTDKGAPGVLDRSGTLDVTIPPVSPVVPTMPPGSTKHVTLSGSPDFSRGPVAVDSVVRVTAVPQNSIFSSFGVPVAFATGAGMTITPTTITTLEEWRNGLTLSVDAGVADRNEYTVTLRQANTLLGTIKVQVTTPAPTSSMAPLNDTMNATAPSGLRDSNDSLLSGRVVDSDGHPIATTLYCGDIRQEYYAEYQTNPNDGSIAIPRDTCVNNGGRVWVVCPYGVTAVPAEIPVSQFNGSTFTCVIPGTAGSLQFMNK